MSDLANHAEYDASSFGVSAGGGSSGSGWSGSASPSLAIRQSESESSTTASGISAGVLEIRGGDESALTNLDRDLTELQHSGLGEIFDEQKVAERMELGQVAGEVGFRAVGDIALDRQQSAVDRYEEAQNQFDAAMLNGDQAGMATAMAAMDAARDDFGAWQHGSAKRTALHIVAGSLQAAFGGGDALAGALGAGSSEWVAGSTDNVLLGLAAGITAGAAAGSAGSGAATGVSGYLHNRKLHLDEQEALERLLEQGYEREQINALACSVVKCWEGADLGVMAAVVEEQTASVMAGLSPRQRDDLLATLQAEAPGLFQYSALDYVADAWKENPGLQEGLVRAGGLLQAAGGMERPW